jgi:formate hydrogenlyase transcriptional activator
VIGAVFKAGKPVVLDLSREQLASHVSSEVRAEGIESGCALPLISRGRTLGVLTLGSRFENAIRPEDAEFLMRAAGQLAIAIENRLAYREVAELKDKLAQEKLYLEDEIRGELDFEGIGDRVRPCTMF